jgi:tripartite-type tricarboxylate transporter receptor subunit TctC
VAGSATTMVAPQVKSLGYDPFRDLVPVSFYTRMPYLFVVNPSLPVRTVQEFIALAKEKPGKLKMASAGIGQGSHLASLLFTLMTGVDSPHMPFGGGGPAYDAVVSNQAQWMIAPMAGPLPHVRAGRLRAIAIGGTSRSPVLPDLPTIAESGVPGYSFGFWGGLFVVKGTPQPIVDKLNAVAMTVLSVPEVNQQFLSHGAEAVSSTPAQLTQFMREEYARMGKVLRTAGLVKD